MNNIKTYDIATDNTVVPSVSYFKNSGSVVYKRDMKFTSNKSEAEPGDLVLSNGDCVYFCTLDWYIANAKYALDEDGNDLYPTGVVVIPASHTSDSTVRICSLKYISPYTYDFEGSNEPVSIYWGAYNVEIDDAVYYDWDTYQTYVPGTTTVSTGESGVMATNYHRVGCEANQDDPGTFWYWYREYDDCGYLPSPYNADGTKSAIYHAAGTLLSDMNGKINTKRDIAWQYDNDGIYKNYINSLDYQSFVPAADSCIHHHVSDTYFGFDFSTFNNDLENLEDAMAKSWYLPSIGELGYLVARMEEIDRTRRFFGAKPLWNRDIWSSTESSYTGAWYLTFTESEFGSVSNAGKDGRLPVIAFASY